MQSANLHQSEHSASPSGMPPAHAPGTSSQVSTPLGTTRENYPTTTTHIPRYPYQSHEASGFLPDYTQASTFHPVRPVPSTLSPAISHDFNMSHGHMQLAGPPRRPEDAPPFSPTKPLHQLSNGSQKPVQAELSAKIDKGFFKADDDWTCYRRNYFAVACSFSLKPAMNSKVDPIYLHRSGHMERISNFAMSIAARVDSEDGKVVELVQHTPKRDKGPMGPPDKTVLVPYSGNTAGFGDSPGSMSPSHQLSTGYDGYGSPTAQSAANVANFDRIQFKNATANNGKRRAAQQYFHVLVELYAEVPTKHSSEKQWIKIATRLSAAMVVRGRSPGHYSDERRGSSTSMGPGGGSSGDSSSSMRDPNGGGGTGPRGAPSFSFSRGSRGTSGTYMSHPAGARYASSESNSDPSSPPMKRGLYDNLRPLGNVVLSKEDAHKIDTFDGYQYYPATLYEPPASGRGGFERQHQASLAKMQGNVTSPGGMKAEEGISGYAGPVQQKMGSGRSCGSSFRAQSVGLGISPFVGVNTSHGVYPAAPTI